MDTVHVPIEEAENEVILGDAQLELAMNDDEVAAVETAATEETVVTEEEPVHVEDIETIAEEEAVIEEDTGTVTEEVAVLEEGTGTIAEQGAVLAEDTGTVVEGAVLAEDTGTVVEEGAVLEEDIGTIVEEEAVLDVDSRTVVEEETVFEEHTGTIAEEGAVLEEHSETVGEEEYILEDNSGTVAVEEPIFEEDIGTVAEDSEVEVVEVLEEAEDEEYAEGEEAALDDAEDVDTAAEQPWEEVFVEVDADSIEETAEGEEASEVDYAAEGGEEVVGIRQAVDGSEGELLHDIYAVPEQDGEHADEDFYDEEHLEPEAEEEFAQSPTKSVSSQPTTVQELAADWLDDEGDSEGADQAVVEAAEAVEDEQCGTTEIVIARVESDAGEAAEETLARGYDVLDMMVAEAGDGEWVGEEEEDVDGMFDEVGSRKRKASLGTLGGKQPKKRFISQRQYNCLYCDWEPPPGPGWKPLKIEHMWREHPEYKADHSCPRCGHFSTTKGWKMKHKCRVYAHKPVSE